MEERYIDFAYPAHKAAPEHLFISKDNGSVYLQECWGAAGSFGRVVRARLDEGAFRRISKALTDHLNARIKRVNTALKSGEKKIPMGKGWNRADRTRIDRILGREV